ncbi:MAG: hypothetical protein ACOC83_08710, partial [Gemmatimonadota bacterium]
MTQQLRIGRGARQSPDGRRDPTSRVRRALVLAVGILGLALSSAAASGQETTEGDTAAADTVPAADTTGQQLPSISDQTARPPPRFPAALELPDSTAGGVARSWGRGELLDAAGTTLLDFLLDEAPELSQLRAGYYAGPHHLMDGLLGPGFVEVVLDGRVLIPLEGAQPDLARISLSRVERVQLQRRAGRTVVEVTTLHHEGGEAYSRIGAATGQPGADLIHGIFANGVGGSAALAGGVDYLNIAAGSMPANRLDTWARVAWMPVDNGSGLELVWRSESVERTAVVASEVDRSELFLHGRADVADGLQAEFWIGTERGTPEGASGDEDPSGGEIEMGVTELQLTATGSRGWARGEFRVHDDPALPDLEARWRGGTRVAGPLHVSGGGTYGRWSRFETWDVEAELGLREEVLGVGLDAGVGASTGRRGLSFPSRASADSVSFDAVEARLALEVGPYTLAGRGIYRDLERMPIFGGLFDRDLAPRGSALARTVEGRLQGPLLPFPGATDALRVTGTWRERIADPDDRTLYVPTRLIEGELAFVDRFFEDDLEVRLSIHARHRSEMLAPTPGLAEPELLSAETSVRAGLLAQIDEFRLWWRGGNLRNLEQADFGGLIQPLNRN